MPSGLNLSEKDKKYSKAWQIDQDQRKFACKLEIQMLEEVERFLKSRK